MKERRRYRVDLPSQMAECDANYMRLSRLFPGMQDENERRFVLALGARDSQVRLSVVERGPYTTLIDIRQLPDAAWLPQAHLRVRLYHDARSAEVVECQGVRHFRAAYGYPNPHMHQPDEKAQVNRLLSEFLTLCLAQGAARFALLPTG
ncbi:MAG TPA: DUF1249 domain-containing protein [Gammaproteobacteria bacterium]|jgi:uncharacterized protein YqiB (DUF1249 family)|nr:DUF1249 domain-containing protein [Gammaproteobacteria bacterium]